MTARQDEIDRGEAPATTIRQLVSAIRQSTCAAGIEIGTARLCLERGDYRGVDAALGRLLVRLQRVEAKMKMALGEEPKNYD